MHFMVYIATAVVFGFVIGDHDEFHPKNLTETVKEILEESNFHNTSLAETVKEIIKDSDSHNASLDGSADSQNKSVVETVKEIAENASKDLSDGVKRLSEGVVHMGNKVKDAMEEMLDEDFSNEDASTTFMGVDATGCNRGLRKTLEDRCDDDYERLNDEAQQIEDEREKTEAVCCTLEDFEKCSLRAYDKASCVTDKAAIRENLKAARLFLSVIANISCSEFRGQCAYMSTASTYTVSYATMVISAFPLFALFARF